MYRDRSGHHARYWTWDQVSKYFKSPRNQEAWNKAQRKKEALLIGYFVGGDPIVGDSIEMIQDSLVAGIDVLEIGVPSPSPFLDGDVIRRGHERVYRTYRQEEGGLPSSYWTLLRDQVSSPIWAMGYCADVIQTGIYRELAEQNLVDGFVLPDCPFEIMQQLKEELKIRPIDLVQFVHSGMSEAELSLQVNGATIVYAQLYAGATGDPLARLQNLGELRTRIQQHTDALVIAGFGIRNPARVRQVVAHGYDGAVVGSALVARCETKERDSLFQLIADMKMATSFHEITKRS